eukprot:1048771-Prymnesium_polylepis.2
MCETAAGGVQWRCVWRTSALLQSNAFVHLPRGAPSCAPGGRPRTSEGCVIARIPTHLHPTP